MPIDSGSDCHITFIGNATVLLELGPFVLLTDPNFLHAGQRAYLGYGLVSKRLKDPSMEVGDLPRLDGVVLSHLHGDHWDRVAEGGLDKAVPILTTPQAATTLDKRGFQPEALRRWQSFDFERDDARLTVTALPGRHGPGVIDRLLPDVMGSMLELEVGGRRRLRLYITGDTLYHADLAQITERFGPIDLMVAHLGGTKLLGLVTVTMDADQGTRLASMVRPTRLIPVHYDDYTVFRSPLTDFEAAMQNAGLQSMVWKIGRGETAAIATPP